jgi:hypothetical protein
VVTLVDFQDFLGSLIDIESVLTVLQLLTTPFCCLDNTLLLSSLPKLNPPQLSSLLNKLREWVYETIATNLSMVFVEIQDEKYYDSYTRSPSQFNSFDWGTELIKSSKRTKHPLQFGIALMNLTFSECCFNSRAVCCFDAAKRGLNRIRAEKIKIF